MTLYFKTALEQLEDLYHLELGWDYDSAPPPTLEALSRAEAIIRWANESGLSITEVDPDVLGGVAIMLGSSRCEIWISCMNDGSDTLVLSEGEAAGGIPWSEDTKDLIVTFLAGQAEP
jgi:hypothetical protein